MGCVLVLAASREAADEIAFEACGAALIGVARAGLRQLVLELSGAELNRRELAPVGRVVREALAARVAAEAARRGELKYLMPVAGFPGFPRALAETFEELRLNGVGAAQVRGCGESGPDLALLLAAYEGELAGRGFADHASRVEMAGARVMERFRETAVLALDLAPRTTRERELVAAILRGSRAHLELARGGGESEPATSLESLQRYLFSTDAVPGSRGRWLGGDLLDVGRGAECVEIARRIGASSIPFDEAAILLRSPERYQPLVVEALRRAGIPAHCTRGSHVRTRTRVFRAAALRGGGAFWHRDSRSTLAGPDAGRRRAGDAGGVGAVDRGRRGDRRHARWEARLSGAARGIPTAVCSGVKTKSSAIA